MKIIKDIFDKPKIIGIIGNVNEAKSNLLYFIINKLREKHNFNIYTFGLRNDIKGASKIFSVQELEDINNSIIILDEFETIIDVNNRKSKRIVESTLRLINHNNNILVLSGVCENYKKFISSKLDVIIYKKITFDDLINGCRVKNVIMNYSGYERGSSLLNLKKNEALIFNGNYTKINVDYMKKYDTKKDNESILKPMKKRSPKRSIKRSDSCTKLKYNYKDVKKE